MGLLWALGGTLIFAVLAGIITKDHEIGLCVGFVFFVASGLGAWIFGDTGIAVIIWILGALCDGRLFIEHAENREHSREVKAQEKCQSLKDEIIRILSEERKDLIQQDSKLLDLINAQNITLQFVDLVTQCTHDDHLLADEPVIIAQSQLYNDHIGELKDNHRRTAEIDSIIEEILKCNDFSLLREYAVSILGEEFKAREAARTARRRRRLTIGSILSAALLAFLIIISLMIGNWKCATVQQALIGRTYSGFYYHTGPSPSYRTHIIRLMIRFDSDTTCTIRVSEHASNWQYSKEKDEEDNEYFSEHVPYYLHGDPFGVELDWAGSPYCPAKPFVAEMNEDDLVELTTSNYLSGEYMRLHETTASID